MRGNLPYDYFILLLKHCITSCFCEWIYSEDIDHTSMTKFMFTFKVLPRKAEKLCFQLHFALVPFLIPVLADK